LTYTLRDGGGVTGDDLMEFMQVGWLALVTRPHVNIMLAHMRVFCTFYPLFPGTFLTCPPLSTFTLLHYQSEGVPEAATSPPPEAEHAVLPDLANLSLPDTIVDGGAGTHVPTSSSPLGGSEGVSPRSGRKFKLPPGAVSPFGLSLGVSDAFLKTRTMSLLSSEGEAHGEQAGTAPPMIDQSAAAREEEPEMLANSGSPLASPATGTAKPKSKTTASKKAPKTAPKTASKKKPEAGKE